MTGDKETMIETGDDDFEHRQGMNHEARAALAKSGRYANEGNNFLLRWFPRHCLCFGFLDDSMPSWRKHKKHVFILSCAGKPIFSRCRVKSFDRIGFENFEVAAP